MECRKVAGIEQLIKISSHTEENRVLEERTRGKIHLLTELIELPSQIDAAQKKLLEVKKKEKELDYNVAGY